MFISPYLILHFSAFPIIYGEWANVLFPKFKYFPDLKNEKFELLCLTVGNSDNKSGGGAKAE